MRRNHALFTGMTGGMTMRSLLIKDTLEGTPDSPLNLLENGSTDGYCVDSTCMGTYTIAGKYMKYVFD